MVSSPVNKKTRVRYLILATVFVNVVINYMDRTNVSVAATAMNQDLHLNPVQLGFIFSAFGWTYAALQIPGGLLTDRFGTRGLYCFILVAWSLVTALQGFASGFVSLLILRMLIGVMEAPSYPMNNRIVTGWFPDRERAGAIGMYTSGQYVGLAFLAPVLTAIQFYTGWRGLFFITGIAGILWGILWYRIYRDPDKHNRINAEELEHIERGGGVILKQAVELNPRKTFNRASFKEVFRYKKLWGIYLGQFCIGSSMWFFLTWFPTYLVKYRGFGFIQSGFASSAPFFSAFAGILVSGFLSDFLMKKGYSAGVARKTPVIAGLLLTVAIIGANYTSNPTMIILFMCIAFFGNGCASITWVFVSALAPKKLIGLTGGVFNFVGNLSAIAIPLLIGYLARAGNFASALVVIGALGIAGTCCYVFLVGKVERVGKSIVNSE